MELLLQNVNQRDTVHLLNLFLEDITKQSATMLEDYLNFFKEKKLHMTWAEYRSSLALTSPFPGFSAAQIERALEKADAGDDKNAAILLLEQFLDHFDEVDRADVDAVKEAIQQGKKLNFGEKIAQKIQSMQKSRSPNPTSTALLKYFLSKTIPTLACRQLYSICFSQYLEL